MLILNRFQFNFITSYQTFNNDKFKIGLIKESLVEFKYDQNLRP